MSIKLKNRNKTESSYDLINSIISDKILEKLELKEMMLSVLLYYYDLENRTSINRENIDGYNHKLKDHLVLLLNNKSENIMFNKESNLFLKIRTLLEKIDEYQSIRSCMSKIILENKDFFENYLVLFYLEREFHFELFCLIILSIVDKTNAINLLTVNYNQESSDNIRVILEEFYEDSVISKELQKLKIFWGMMYVN